MTNEVHLVVACEGDRTAPLRAFMCKEKAGAFLKLCAGYDRIEPKLTPFKRGMQVDSMAIYAQHESNRRSWERGHPAGPEFAYSTLIAVTVPLDVD